MSQTSEDREDAILSALDDFYEEKYLDVAKTVAAYDVKARTLQRRVQRKNSRYTRPATIRALNLAQEQMLFEYIARLDAIGMSFIPKMLRSSANYILNLHDFTTQRSVKHN